MTFKCYSEVGQQPNAIVMVKIFGIWKKKYFIKVQSVNITWPEVNKQLKEIKEICKVIIISLFQNLKLCLQKKRLERTWNLDVSQSEVNKQLRIPVDSLTDHCNDNPLETNLLSLCTHVYPCVPLKCSTSQTPKLPKS